MRSKNTKFELIVNDDGENEIRRIDTSVSVPNLTFPTFDELADELRENGKGEDEITEAMEAVEYVDDNEWVTV